MLNLISSPDKQLYTGTFGLERETLRVTENGRMAHTEHPFPDDPHIVKDFCENQTEINTGVHTSPESVIAELSELTERVGGKIAENGEKLWMYSNPPYLDHADDIPVAHYEGAQKGKQSYRMYLAEKYGKYKMTLSGIHVNYSLSDQLLQEGFSRSSCDDFTDYKNDIYLKLAQGVLSCGWIINLLLSASPVCDGSYFDEKRSGETVLTRYASLRCGEEGYWNDFTPTLRYTDILSYAQSIQRYIDSGTLMSVSELYYPVRLKPRGENRLNNLVQNGVNHIEIRNVDINPFCADGIDARDLRFIELLLLYLAAHQGRRLTDAEQETAIQNLKNAALYDIDSAEILSFDGTALSAREAGIRLLRALKDFYSREEIARAASEYAANEVFDFQLRKLTIPGARYAERVAAAYGDDYAVRMIGSLSI